MAYDVIEVIVSISYLWTGNNDESTSVKKNSVQIKYSRFFRIELICSLN